MTTESASRFFSEPINLALMRRLTQDLHSQAPESIEPEGLVQALSKILELILANTEKFDEFSSVNIDWIGKSFMGEIANYLESSPEKRPAQAQALFPSAYRFLCELEFTQPGEPSFEIRRIHNFVNQNLDKFSGIERQQLVFAMYSMPAQVTKQLISNPAITHFRNFSQAVETSKKLKNEWDNDLNQREKLLKALAANIGKLTAEYNFVGLVDGFKRLRSQKEAERVFSFRSLTGIGLALLIFPLSQLAVIAFNLQTIDNHRSVLAYSLPAMLTVEIVLVYFFRVVLGQFRSVKAQLLQIDLRISLCQFIESYAEYVTNLRKDDATALSKFESLVFSGLVAGESEIPSTFDGAEQIASLIRSLRGSTKNDA